MCSDIRVCALIEITLNNFLLAYSRWNKRYDFRVLNCGVQLNLIPSIEALIVCVLGWVYINCKSYKSPVFHFHPAGYVQPYYHSGKFNFVFIIHDYRKSVFSAVLADFRAHHFDNYVLAQSNTVLSLFNMNYTEIY